MREQSVNEKISKLFPTLEIILPNEILSELVNTTPDEWHLFHFGLGLFVRNNFLPPGCKLYDAFINYGIHDKDDMSEMILRLFCEHLKKNDL